ncbi:hypothetical protein [Novosphingobium sp. 9]|uniref:hypothetical protein n=1 Tax=Novosphingobium sp. 9 TaxID=2025349 RepID=UPI0021B610E7|nr:hypothetical protein [Novosphingobium sp. 9]
MSDTQDHLSGAGSLEAAMRVQLMQGDAVAQEARPILRHLLQQDSNDLFSEEIVARVKGMIRSLANALQDAIFADDHYTEAAQRDMVENDFFHLLVVDEAMLQHLHAMALEYQVTQRLQARLSLDAVTSPLVRELIASSDMQLQSLAMAYLAAQARWCQSQRRMAITVAELPAAQFDVIMAALHGVAAEHSVVGERLPDCVRRLKEARGLGRCRLDLARSIVDALPVDAEKALSIEHAGVGLFVSTLAGALGEVRDQVAFSLHASQSARLLLQLRAAGLRAAAVELQFVMIHPGLPLPMGIETLGADRAAEVLAQSGRAVA